MESFKEHLRFYVHIQGCRELQVLGAENVQTRMCYARNILSTKCPSTCILQTFQSGFCLFIGKLGREVSNQETPDKTWRLDIVEFTNLILHFLLAIVFHHQLSLKQPHVFWLPTFVLYLPYDFPDLLVLETACVLPAFSVRYKFMVAFKFQISHLSHFNSFTQITLFFNQCIHLLLQESKH